MNENVSRLRMFAGPNGSGKSTVKNGLPAKLFTVYVNPDDLEKSIRDEGVLSLEPYGINFTSDEIRGQFTSSPFLVANKLAAAASVIDCQDGILKFHGLEMNSYYASVLSDVLRRKMLQQSISFTFETVMSAPDKVELLRESQNVGYRTYLYFVATEDPSINIDRVKIRVAEGGHNVPEDKIVTRYHRSLDLLIEAIRSTNRAYFFDTSNEETLYFAEITNGVDIDLKTAEMPNWFKAAVWDKL